MGCIFEVLAVGPIQTNCYIVGSKSSSEAIIIDPGGDFDLIKDKLSALSLKPKVIVNTHAHIDHIGAVNELKQHYDIKFGLHKEDISVLESAPMAAAMFGLENVQVPEVDFYLKEGDEVKLEGLKLKIIETPGHTMGGVCFLGPDFLISGDTLFHASIGRTDLPGGSFKTIIKSIVEKLFVLRNEIFVYPGHGERTTIGDEKSSNPYLKERNI